MLNKKMLSGLILILFLILTISNGQSKESDKEKTKIVQMDHKYHKMNDEKLVTKSWNEVCPVRGNKVQENSITVEFNDKEYGFCCPGCDSKFEKDPEKYSKNLSEDGKEFIGKN